MRCPLGGGRGSQGHCRCHDSRVLQVLRPFETRSANDLQVLALIVQLISLWMALLWRDPLFAPGTIPSHVLIVVFLILQGLLFCGFIAVILRLLGLSLVDFWTRRTRRLAGSMRHRVEEEEEAAAAEPQLSLRRGIMDHNDSNASLPSARSAVDKYVRLPHPHPPCLLSRGCVKDRGRAAGVQVAGRGGGERREMAGVEPGVRAHCADCTMYPPFCATHSAVCVQWCAHCALGTLCVWHIASCALHMAMLSTRHQCTLPLCTLPTLCTALSCPLPPPLLCSRRPPLPSCSPAPPPPTGTQPTRTR